MNALPKRQIDFCGANGKKLSRKPSMVVTPAMPALRRLRWEDPKSDGLAQIIIITATVTS